MANSPSMICSVMTKLKSEKSTGPNSWPIEVTKQCSQQISNHCPSFRSGVLPQTGKLPTSLPIHKKGSHNVASNYRLVSLMANAYYCEDHGVNSVFDYLISNNLISSNQFGFLPGHSCTTQLLHVANGYYYKFS